MAISAYTTFSAGDVNLTALMNATNSIFTGYNALTLTHMNDTTEPAIAAGSKIEVNGALYQSETETAITGSPSDGVVYIYIDPSGPSAVFTNTAPTWSDSKQGWYGTGGTANCRYVGRCYKNSTSYSNKTYYTSVESGYRIISTRISVTWTSSSIPTFTHGIPFLRTNRLLLMASLTDVQSPNTIVNDNLTAIAYNDTQILFYLSGATASTDGFVDIVYKI
jgi:hypothetical protein